MAKGNYVFPFKLSQPVNTAFSAQKSKKSAIVTKVPLNAMVTPLLIPKSDVHWIGLL